MKATAYAKAIVGQEPSCLRIKSRQLEQAEQEERRSEEGVGGRTHVIWAYVNTLAFL